MKLPAPSVRYDNSREADRNRILEKADRENHKRGQDLYVSPGRLLYQAESGEVYSIKVNDTGQLQVDGDPEFMLQTSVYGQVFYPGAGTVSIATAGVYVVTGLTGVLDATLSEGISLSDNQIGIKNTSGKVIRVPIYASYDGKAGNNKELGLKLALNGTPIDETECRSASGSARQEAKLVTRWMFELQPNDEVAIAVANVTDTADIEISRARVIVA